MPIEHRITIFKNKTYGKDDTFILDTFLYPHFESDYNIPYEIKGKLDLIGYIRRSGYTDLSRALKLCELYRTRDKIKKELEFLNRAPEIYSKVSKQLEDDLSRQKEPMKDNEFSKSMNLLLLKLREECKKDLPSLIEKQREMLKIMLNYLNESIKLMERNKDSGRIFSPEEFIESLTPEDRIK